MAQGKGLSPSMEGYLEVISDLVKEKQVARTCEISRRLKVDKSSVTGAMKSLSAKGLIDYEPYGFITLTKKGRSLGAKLTRRREILSEFLEKVLAMPPGEAQRTARRIGHAVDDGLLERFARLVGFVETP